MHADIHMIAKTTLTASAYVVTGGDAPFDCFKLNVATENVPLDDEFTILRFTAEHAAEIIRALQEQYPELRPPVYRGGSGFDDPEFAEPPCGGDGCREGEAIGLVNPDGCATCYQGSPSTDGPRTCAECVPFLHDHDCSALRRATGGDRR